MEKSTKMVAVLVLAVLAAATGAEARNIKTTEAAGASKDAVLQPTTFPPFDRFGGASPAFGGLPGSSGSSIPGFSLPGSGGVTPGFGGIGSMPFLGGGSPGLGGFGGMPGSPAAGAVDEHAKKP